MNENIDFDNVWECAYNLNGFGLADYLNEFSQSDIFHSTQHGEKVYITNGPSWSEWSSFMHKVSYYFDGLVEAVKNATFEISEEEVISILVYVCCVNSNVFSAYEVFFFNPEKYNNFLFC